MNNNYFDSDTVKIIIYISRYSVSCLSNLSSVTSVLHLAGRVIAHDLLVQADTDHQQLTGRGEGQTGPRGFMGAVKHVDLLLGVGVPQHHRAAVRNTAQQGALQHGQPQVMDGLKIKQEFCKSSWKTAD